MIRVLQKQRLQTISAQFDILLNERQTNIMIVD